MSEDCASVGVPEVVVGPPVAAVVMVREEPADVDVSMYPVSTSRVKSFPENSMASAFSLNWKVEAQLTRRTGRRILVTIDCTSLHEEKLAISFP